MKRLIQLNFVLIPAFLLLSACGGGMQAMPSEELAAKMSECAVKNPTSPGRVTACENIRKECESRRDDGDFAC